MSKLVTAQLTGLYDQCTLRVKAPAPPKGWKKFTPRYREAMIIVSMDQPAQAVPILVCPRCDSPRFYMDAFGWIWLKEKGLSELDHVSACTICGARVWGIKPVTLPVCYYKAEPGFRRHPEDVVEFPDSYIDAPEPDEDQVNREVSTDEIKRVGAFIDERVKHKPKPGKTAPRVTYKLHKKKLKDAELHKAK